MGTPIVHIKNLPIGTKFKCQIGVINEWRIYKINNVKYTCPVDDSKNMANRNWELNEFCNVFNDREIEVIDDNVADTENIKKEYKVDDIIRFKDLRDNKNITTKLIKDFEIGDVVQTKFGNEDVVGMIISENLGDKHISILTFENDRRRLGIKFDTIAQLIDYEIILKSNI